MAISAQNRYYQVWQAFLDGKYTLCLTNSIIEEYSEVMDRNISPLISDMILTVILNRKNVLKLDPSFEFNLIKADPDDNKFVDCAIVGNAKYIVTQDHHFNVLKQIDFPKVDVITIQQFLSELDKI
jgi:predicted nucleic acid-binding protein